MQRTVVNPPEVHEPVAPYSHALVTTPGKIICVSGQVPVDSNGHLVGVDNFELQVEQVFVNLSQILDTAGASFRHIVKLGSFLTRSSDISAFTRKRNEIFANVFPDGDYPTSTLLLVSGLADPKWLVEVEAYASIP